jgi:hypothetical protein
VLKRHLPRHCFCAVTSVETTLQFLLCTATHVQNGSSERHSAAHYDVIIDGEHYPRVKFDGRFTREETLNTVETNIKFLTSLCRNQICSTQRCRMVRPHHEDEPMSRHFKIHVRPQTWTSSRFCQHQQEIQNRSHTFQQHHHIRWQTNGLKSTCTEDKSSYQTNLWK